MTSSRPYLIRALNDWINDNGLTPYILVDVTLPGVEVPRQHIHDGKIVLNIAARAVQDLHLGNDEIAFSARFSGVSMTIRVPVEAVLSIYAMESGEGMVFNDTVKGDEPPPDDTPPDTPKKPTLRVIK